MNLDWILLQILITAYSVASPNPLYHLAAKMPQDPIYINASTVRDLNEDGVPEVYLAAGSGWRYYIYYLLDDTVCSVEDLEPWAWSSNLCYTADGRLVLYAFPHTTGTADNLQYRVYEWTSSGYHLAEDLWHRPAQLDESGEDGLDYISSPVAIDPFVMEEYSALLITKKEFDQKVADLGEMASVFDREQDSYREWEHGEDPYDNLDEIYGEIQKQILHWQ